MKHRMIEFLAREMGFTVFAIEANMPEAEAVNAYVLRGEGDPKAALAGMYFWTWNTEEVLDMIEWMREFNAAGEGRIEFWGFDMQTPTVAMDKVRGFVEMADPAYMETCSAAYDKASKVYAALSKIQTAVDGVLYEPWQEKARQVLDHLSANRNVYLETHEPAAVDWAIQNARIVLQAAEIHMDGGQSRDESMAQNVMWILEHSPLGSKMVLWAHNGHVSRGLPTYPSMGKFLGEEYGDEMVVFGFAFHEGDYTAVGDEGLGTYRTSASEPGSLEWALHQTGLPRLILDLRGVDPASPESGWLGRQVYFRSIGAKAQAYAFGPRTVADEFDLVIFFDKTQPSVPLETSGPSH
jgi:erythromycin esterase